MKYLSLSFVVGTTKGKNEYLSFSQLCQCCTKTETCFSPPYCFYSLCPANCDVKRHLCFTNGDLDLKYEGFC